MAERRYILRFIVTFPFYLFFGNRGYFTTRLFFTDLTPVTPRATSPAFCTLLVESTKPLNWTSPLNVSTLIWNTFRDGSFRIAAFTFVVIAESSTNSPVPSRVGVDAHPRNATTNVMQTRKLNMRCLFVMMLSPFVWSSGGGGESPPLLPGV